MLFQLSTDDLKDLLRKAAAKGASGDDIDDVVDEIAKYAADKKYYDIGSKMAQKYGSNWRNFFDKHVEVNMAILEQEKIAIEFEL